MAKKATPKKKEGKEEAKLTKAQLMRQIDEKLTGLNLIKSALQVDPSRTQETLINYQTRFQELMKEK